MRGICLERPLSFSHNGLNFDMSAFSNEEMSSEDMINSKNNNK